MRKGNKASGSRSAVVHDGAEHVDLPSSSDNESVRDGDLQAMFEEWKSDLTAQFLGAMQNSTQNLLQNVSGMLDTRLAPVHAHINNHSAMLAALNH
eukprot:3832944-Karenia_brevis.AAC.1